MFVHYVRRSTAVVGRPYHLLVVTYTSACEAYREREVGALPPGVRFVRDRCGQGRLIGTPKSGSSGTYRLRLIATSAHLRATMPLTLVVATSAPRLPEQSLSPPDLVPVQPAGHRLPPKVSYGAGLPWSLLGNGLVGDCTEAAFLDLAELFAAEAGRHYRPTLSGALRLYSWATGGEGGPQVGTPTWLLVRRWEDAPIGGQHILAAGQLEDASSRPRLEAALRLAGGLLAEVNWPHDGMHELVVDGASPSGVDVVTWGSQRTISWSRWRHPGFLVQVLVLESSLWRRTGHTPSGAPVARLAALFGGT